MTGSALSLCISISLLTAGAARSATHYLDPVRGGLAGDGSAAAPWGSLQEVIEAGLIETREWDGYPYDASRTLVAKNAGAPIKAGDTLRLLSGYHGAIELARAYNAEPIVIEAEPGHTPALGSVLFQAASGWIARGLSISPEHLPSYDSGVIVRVESHNWSGPSHDIVIEDCELYSMRDASGWSEADWNSLAANGVNVSGDRVTLRRNRLRNVNFGISVSGEDALVEHNVIDSFAGDGLRGLGDRGVFQYNTVKNCYDVNDNHDDGFQSWSLGPGGSVGEGEVVGIVLRGNTIINFEDPMQPFRGALQGIGCFDGFFTEWIVENNVVITDHWHGITLLGARDSRIVNNTVIDQNADRPGPPWISIDDHKTRGASSGCLIRNNLATDFTVGAGVSADSNITVAMSGLDEHFVDAAGFDLRLVAASAAIDTGASELAPADDRDRVIRPQGDAVDVGAHEWFDGEPTGLPSADAGPSLAICLGDTVSIGGSPTATGGAGAPYRYGWTSTPLDPSMSCGDCANPEVSPVATTLYELTVTDAAERQAEASVTVTLGDVADLPVALGNTLKLVKALVIAPLSADDLVAWSERVEIEAVAHVVRRSASPSFPTLGTLLGSGEPGEPLRLPAELLSPVSPGYYRAAGVNCAGAEGPL